jgi:predicted Zn-dependent protease
MSTSESADGSHTEARSEWTGFYYDGATAAKRPVVVTVRQGGIQVDVDDKRPRFWAFHDLRQTQGWLEGEQLRLEIGSDPVQAVSINEPGLPEAIRRRGGDISRTIRGRARTARVLGILAAIIVGLGALYYWLAPTVADRLAMRMPAKWEVSLGERAEQTLAPLNQQCTDSAGLAALRTMLERLTAAQGHTEYKFRIVALQDSTVNAFAAPGGLIAVNEGLLREARSPEEVAGVLAHEIQHVMRRHSTRSLFRELPMRFAIGALAGGTGIETAASAIGTVGAFSYRRDDEAEADREGLRLLAAARVDAAPAADFMERLEKGDGTSGVARYLSTHPAPLERAAELRRLAADQGPTEPVLDPQAFAAAKAVCSNPTAGSGPGR